jgi:nucleoside-diphosphate-sugar epimerase
LTVLVVVSTRILGSKIVAAVLDKGTIEVEEIVRLSNDSNKEKRQKIAEMKAKGAGIIEEDLIKPETLLRACAEVDVIVSAVGNNEVTVLGQKNLIYAAKQQGVKRFIPSDYSVDYRQLSLGRQRQPGYAAGGVGASCLWLVLWLVGAPHSSDKYKIPNFLRSWGF